MGVPRWVVRFRGALVTPPLIFALLWPSPATGAAGLYWAVATSAALLGVGVRVWAQQHLRHRLKVPMQFTTTGPFQFVRNPLYIGNTLIQVGATLASKLLWVVPITLLWSLSIYSLVVRYEEAQLVAQYGEAYRRYRGEVPRWFPRPERSGLRFSKLGLVNQWFGAAVRAELHCLLILLPFVLKELAPHWFQP